jgi:hypothetical protein
MELPDLRRTTPKLTAKVVRELLDYNPDTGVLTWRERDRRWFKNIGAWHRWNVCYAGKRTGCLDNRQRRCIGIFGRQYLEHRVVFLWMTGRWPKPEVDHIDHDTTNNKWKNLRKASRKENAKNQSLFRTNKSGHVGIYRCYNWGYLVQIGVNGRIHQLGRFPTMQKAIAARLAAQRQHGFFKNHGR